MNTELPAPTAVAARPEAIQLVAVFAATVLLLQTVLEPLTRGNTLAVAGSTPVVATLFAPVRSIVQRAVDRRFDRSRYDGERLLGASSERLRDEVELDALVGEIVKTTGSTVAPATTAVWIRDMRASS